MTDEPDTPLLRAWRAVALEAPDELIDRRILRHARLALRQTPGGWR